MSPVRSVLHDGEVRSPTFDAGPGSSCQLLVSEQLSKGVRSSVPASRPEGGPHGDLGSVRSDDGLSVGVPGRTEGPDDSEPLVDRAVAYIQALTVTNQNA